MPAAAVIPAPVAYIKVVAVKKLVVGCLAWWFLRLGSGHCALFVAGPPVIFGVFVVGGRSLVPQFLAHLVYFEKIRVFKAGSNASEYTSME